MKRSLGEALRDKNYILGKVKSVLLVVLGTLILSFGCGVFIVPFDLVSGGMPSMGIILSHALPFEFMTVDLYIAILTWVFFFIGLIVLGREFAMKTLISTLIYPPFISVFLRLSESDFLGGFFNLESSAHGAVAILLAAIFGGASVGTGCALTFLGGGSTGGVDIIALSISKYFKRVKSSVILFCVDTTLVILGMFFIGDFLLSLLGVVSAFISAIVIDKIFLGRSRAFIANIISDKYEEINTAIIEKIHRTTTVTSVVGGYSGEGKRMLMVSFTMRQYAELLAVINRIDKDAFITVYAAHEINGRGWTFGEHD